MPTRFVISRPLSEMANLVSSRDHALNISTLSGKWILFPSSDVIRINYHPNHPDGLTHTEIFHLRRKLIDGVKEHRRDRKTIDGLGCMLYGADLGYAESMKEAELLVAALDRGSEGLPYYTEALREAGFELKSRNHYALVGQNRWDAWEKQIKSGTFGLIIHDSDFDDLPHGAIHCMYSGHGAAHWHNVFKLDTDRLGQDRNPDFRWHVLWPNDITDLRPIAVSHLLGVIEKRMARERTRLSTPLRE
jgi:hypothetical protein